jgi:ribonuclease P protein component
MQTFRKNERLCGKKSIDELFMNGQTFHAFPFKIIWLSAVENNGNPARVLISVPKRNFKKAVQRNRVKRLIREVYRKHKSILYVYLLKNETEINIAFIYTGNKVLSYKELDEKIIFTLDRLIKAHEKTIS